MKPINEAKKIDEALNQAIGYCETINGTNKYNVKIAVGVAGEEDNGFSLRLATASTTGKN